MTEAKLEKSKSSVRGQASRVNRKGFTILEVLMSIALITVIAGIGIPVYQTFQVKNDLDVATNTWAQVLARAQELSRAVDGDASWGVESHSGSINLFKGASYAARDTNFDELFDVPTSISFSGVTEIVFSKFYGLPQSTGSTTLTATTSETRVVTINSKGMISY